ncbi:hypothetical protein [Endozoicomonas sp. 4G]|uniref:hypothetical protein n=1 Tax=Endozoicomonas sp. 4G TaxID=2872754 RepID=UPI0020787BA9|nr:hypothetical protein [Endozoicomonas sp. 4G]
MATGEYLEWQLPVNQQSDSSITVRARTVRARPVSIATKTQGTRTQSFTGEVTIFGQIDQPFIICAQGLDSQGFTYEASAVVPFPFSDNDKSTHIYVLTLSEQTGRMAIKESQPCPVSFNHPYPFTSGQYLRSKKPFLVVNGRVEKTHDTQNAGAIPPVGLPIKPTLFQSPSGGGYDTDDYNDFKRPPFMPAPDKMMVDLILLPTLSLPANCRDYQPFIGVYHWLTNTQPEGVTIVVRFGDSPPLTFQISLAESRELTDKLLNTRELLHWLAPRLSGREHLIQQLLELTADSDELPSPLSEEILKSLRKQLAIVLELPDIEFSLEFECSELERTFRRQTKTQPPPGTKQLGNSQSKISQNPAVAKGNKQSYSGNQKRRKKKQNQPKQNYPKPDNKRTDYTHNAFSGLSFHFQEGQTAMNDGLPPAYSNATGATPSQSPLPDSNKQTKAPPKLNPDAPVFVPRRQHAHQPSISHQNILHRQTTACRKPSSQTLYPPVEKESPKEAKVKINRAYSMLSHQNFIDAESTFRSILQEYEDSLATYDYQQSVIGLARSLNESNEKQKEACLLLEKLRSEHDLNKFGASTVRDLDLTLSLSEERLGLIADAQARLLKLREKQPNANEETLCRHSRFFDADMAQARLWQHTGKPQLTEKLLLSMKKGLTSKLDLQPHAAKVKRLQHLLQTVNITLAQFWRETGQYKLTEDLILQMSDKHPDDSIEKLCKPSKNNDVDLSLVRIWEATYQYKLAEKLLLNIIDKQPDDDEEILCTPSGKQDIDIALARLWRLMRKHKRTEILLLNMSNKKPGDREDILCRPCGNHDIDLTLLRQWEVMDKNHLAKKLIERCYALYRSSKFQLALLCLYAGEAKFMEIVRHHPTNANTLLSHSIHYFTLACQQINDNKTELGKDSLNKALEYAQLTIEKYPQTAGAYAQKAHIIRMLGASEEEWRKLFDTADAMDGERSREKGIKWRRNELAALKIIETTWKKDTSKKPETVTVPEQ